MNWRGRYEGGGFTVTAKHWWNPRERKSARLAALVFEAKSEEINAAVRDRMKRYLLYGESLEP